MRQKAKGFSPFKQAVSIHLCALSDPKVDYMSFQQAMLQHQENIIQLRKLMLQEQTEKMPEVPQILPEEAIPPNEAQTPEAALYSVANFFPYHIILPLFLNQSFFSNLLKIAIAFNPDNFKSSVLAIYKLLDVTNLPQFTKIAVAEVLLDYFVADIKKSIKVSELDNFQFLQNCKLLINAGYSMLTSEKTAEKLQTISESDQNSSKSSHSEKLIDNIELSDKTCLCFDDDGVVLELSCLEPVWVQLRRMPVAVSTTSVFVILEKALNSLRMILLEKEIGIGADEVFPFFVICLVNAKILELPTLLSLLEKYTVSDLMVSKNTYMMTQLNSAFEFIQTRQVRVPPFLIFPFESTDNDDLKREGNGHVLLPRFAVYAYPTYIESPFPAFLYYTGLPTDCAIGYPFSAVEGRVCKSLINLGNRFTTLPTTSGSIFQLDPEEIEKNSMTIPKTVKAVKALMPGFRNEFFINLKVFNFIMRLVPPKKKQ